ncbi:Prevent-host-death family protein [Desulfamplus magnetovallimortis]|uniref:Prevent-host-death family protein n=1 Tax=Desulfamplus magnetovallimortis TaxID=1246637 RepID=A0A1W1H944_9BACT|nr:hypothetical protein [Desulfamplus magnetovallimortis]SLM28982.1 Prevent-host-death family protein [Desulfamplus magnetovallimortis]
MIVNISEAEKNFSKLIDMVYQGEEIIIAKNEMPLVKLVVHTPQKKRQLGLLAGQINIPDDLLEEDEDINTIFYGNNS